MASEHVLDFTEYKNFFIKYNDFWNCPGLYLNIFQEVYMQMKFKQETDLEVQRSGERNFTANLLTRVFIKHSGIG